MGNLGGFEFNGLKELQKSLNTITDREVNTFFEQCARELAARLLSKVIRRTPVGDYSKTITVTAKRDGKKRKKGETYTKKINPSGKLGGTLRRGWTAGKSARAGEYADSLRVHHFDTAYVIEIINPVEYAPYVEYGHRTRGGKRWVKGRFMLTISEQELRVISPQLLERRLKQFMREKFK